MYYSMQVFYQVQVWRGRTDIITLHWGWSIHRCSFVPLMTHLSSAAKVLLEVITCKCKTGRSTLKCSCKKMAYIVILAVENVLDIVHILLLVKRIMLLSLIRADIWTYSVYGSTKTAIVNLDMRDMTYFEIIKFI